MKTIDKTVNEFRKAFLERLHGCSYEEAKKKEDSIALNLYDGDFCHEGLPITLGRLMAALGTLRTEILISHGVMVRFYTDDLGGFYWKLLREDKTECDETDQTEETLIALTNILR